jgi:hypothetical protein
VPEKKEEFCQSCMGKAFKEGRDVKKIVVKNHNK